jgi:hypothetical protein
VYWRSGTIGRPPGGGGEEELSLLDASEVDDVAYDGRALLITEFGEGGGVGRSSVYLRKLDDSLPVRLGDGQGFAISPDGSHALAMRRTSPVALVMLPTGAGEPITLRTERITDFGWADWHPDGKSVVFSGSEKGRASRCYVQEITGGAPRPFTPEGTYLFIGQRVISPDGATAAVIGTDGKASLYPVAGGAPRAIHGLETGDVPIRWSSDERSLFVLRRSSGSPVVYQVDLGSGANVLWKEIRPPDPAGISNVWGVHIGPDETAYYYCYTRITSDLYLVEGLR